MSAAVSAAPRRRPVDPAPRRHVEVVPTRAQRRARPKVAYAVITVASLFLIFGAQLMLSIVVSDGAYQIAHLQGQQKELLRSQEALTEQLDVAASSQALAINAANLGMVPASSPLFLDLESGAVTGAPGADAVASPGCGTQCNLIANQLLAGMVPISPAAASAATAATPRSVAPAARTTAPTTTTAPAATTGTAPPTTPSTPSAPTPVTALPAPVTH